MIRRISIRYWLVCQGDRKVTIIKLFKAACKAARLAIAPAALVAVAACSPGMTNLSAPSGPRTAPSKPVKVALLVPAGSGQPSDDILATALENAARMAISDLQGAQIQLQVYNTGGSAAGASSAATTALNDGSEIILGPVYAEAANAVGVIAAQRGVNVLAFSNNATIAGNNVFVLGPLFQTSANRLMTYAKAQGKQSVTVVYADNLAGELGQNAVSVAARRAGMQVNAAVRHEFSQQGVIAAIPQIKASAANSDTLFLTGTTDGTIPLLTQLLPESGLSPDTTQYVSLTRLDIPAQTLELPGVQGSWFSLPDPSRTAQFNGRYQATYGTVAHPIAGLAYDGIAAIGALVASGRPDALSKPSLTQAQGFEGVTGIFRLNPDGTNDRGLAVATIQNKQIMVIDSAPSSFARAGF